MTGVQTCALPICFPVTIRLVLSDSQNPLIYGTSINLLPLLSYQKIYFDFFSNSQWEKHQAFAYNVDYWDGKSAFTKQTMSFAWMQLRYCNYPEDMFMGVLPASQYGSVAVLPSIDSSYSPSTIIASNSSSQVNLINPTGGSKAVSTVTILLLLIVFLL